MQGFFYFQKFSQLRVIKIKGEVWKAPVGAAPTNTPLSFLKRQLQ